MTIKTTHMVGEIEKGFSKPEEPQEFAATEPKEITPAPEVDTSDWKTYRNENYGFGFRYPPAWIQASVRNKKAKDLRLVEDQASKLFWTPEQIRTFSENPLQRPFLSVKIHPLNGGSLFSYVEEKALTCEIWFGFGSETVWGLKRKERKVTSSGIEYFDVVCIDGELASDVRMIYFGNSNLAISLTFHYPWHTLYQEEIIDSFYFVE